MSRKYLSLLLILFIPLMPLVLAEDTNFVGIANPTVTTTYDYDAPDVANIRTLQTKYDPYPAEPGQYVTVWFSVQNWGEEDLDHAYFRMIPEHPFRLDRGDFGIKDAGKIAAFDERLLEFKMIVNEDTLEGTYETELKQCSDEKCSKYLKSIPIRISVKTGGSPRIRVGLEASDVFNSGKKGEVTINIVNRGKLDIKFLTLTLLPAEEYDILSPVEVYVGELESDDFDTVDFDIFMNENIATSATMPVTLPVRVEYTDSNNKDYDDRAQVDITVYSPEDMKRFGFMQDGGGYGTYGIIILIIVGAGYWFWRKKKKHH
jgi:hypothetical protein